MELRGRLERFKVASKFRGGMFFHRMFRDADVYGDIDEFRLNGDCFAVVDNKTVADPTKAAKRWYVAPYLFQVALYCWILEPVLKELKLRLADSHEIVWFDSRTALRAACPCCTRELPPTPVTYDAERVEAQLTRIHSAFHDPKLLIYPEMPWKCESCSEVYRKNCPRGSAQLADATPPREKETG